MKSIRLTRAKWRSSGILMRPFTATSTTAASTAPAPATTKERGEVERSRAQRVDYKGKELRLVRGVTDEAFEKLRPFVTVSSSGMVNINTAPKEVLMSLSAGSDAADAGAIDGATADAILAYRKDHPFSNARDIGKVSTSLGNLYERTRFRDLVDVRSTAFRVRATGEFGDTSRTVDAVGIRTGNEIQWRSWRLE